MALDYVKLGLKCGIEIHQQLESRKLFCSCPSVIRDEKPDVVVRRRMRAVAGELGDVDPAALHEFLKNRELTYEAYADTNCLVELDEEPPHPINEEALKTTLAVALMLKAKPVSELQVMRKTVIDGSNTSGFQRTVLVALDGVIETSKGPVAIPTICLEEDAARIIEDKGDKVTYRLDRLGIPLVEIATSPDIVSPDHARETAERIGLMLRATGKVKRGLGTIRQDLNVSIREGERIEVKGVQELRAIPKLVENEVLRQVGLIEIKKELEKRNAKRERGERLEAFYIDIDQPRSNLPPAFPVTDITSIFKDDGRQWIKKAIDAGKKVWVIRLPGFSGLLGKELMPDHRFGTELSHVAKATAGIGGILHSDESDNETLSNIVSKKLGLGPEDAWVAIIEKESPGRAFTIILMRCGMAFSGVPKETRKANDEKTEFMRPLPGSHRMYPETDEPPIPTDPYLAIVKANLPKLPEEKLKDFAELGLGAELANQLVHSTQADAFMSFTGKFPNMKPSLIAQTLLATPKEAKKRYNAPVERLSAEHFEAILAAVDSGLITKDVVVEVMRFLSESPQKKAEDVIAEKGLGLVSGEKLKEAVRKVLEQDKVSSGGELLGKVMASVSGRARAEEVRRLIAETGRKQP